MRALNTATRPAIVVAVVSIMTQGLVGAAHGEADTVAPTIEIYTPYDGLSVDQVNYVPANFVCQDEADGSGLASCTAVQQNGTQVENGDALDTMTAGAKSLTVTAMDNAGNVTTLTHHYDVVSNGQPEPWPFGGFLRPIDPQPVVNVSKAGSVIPVKFSLGGDRGLDIFADGSPKSAESDCVSGAENDVVEITGSPGDSVLTYDAASDVYHYNWQTSKSWKNTCRTFLLSLADGTTHRASFKFF